MNRHVLLDRLGLPQPDSLDPTTLRRIHHAWRTRVPYENLDLQLDRPIRIDPTYLVDKFGRRSRGGTCFQMNGALSILLSDVGFDVTVVEGAVPRATHDEQPWGNHIALLVELDTRQWLADVGIGDSFLEPLPLQEGTCQQGSLNFRLERLSPEIWRVHHPAGGTITSYDIHTAPRTLAEYADSAAASHPVLRRILVAQHHRHGQELALRSRIVTTTGPQGKQRRILHDLDDFTETLTTQFEVPLDDIGADSLQLLWNKTGVQYDEWIHMSARR